MTSIGDLVVNLSANTSRFRRDMRQAQTISQRATSAISSHVGGMIAGFASVTGAVALFTRSLSDLDAIAKTSDSLGIASEKLMGLNFAFEQTGVSVQSGQASLQRMTRRLAEAARGAGPAAQSIRQLGLDAAILSRMTPDAALEKIADAMLRVDNQTERVRHAFNIFGREGVDLVNTIAGGSEGLREFQNTASRLGATMDRESLRAVEDFNDSLNRLKKLLAGITNQLTADIAPALTLFTELLTAANVKIGNVTVNVERLREAAKTLSGPFAHVRRLLGHVEAMYRKLQGASAIAETSSPAVAIPEDVGVGASPSGVATPPDAAVQKWQSINDQIASVTRQVLLLKGVSEDTLTLNQMSEDGATQDQIERMRQLLEQMRQLKAEQDRVSRAERDAARASETFADAIERAREELQIASGDMTRIDQTIKRFRDMGISEEQLDRLRGILEATDQTNRIRQRNRFAENARTGAAAAQRGSESAMQTLLNSMRRSPQVAEQRRGNSILGQIRDRLNPDQTAGFIIQGAE